MAAAILAPLKKAKNMGMESIRPLTIVNIKAIGPKDKSMGKEYSPIIWERSTEGSIKKENKLHFDF